MSTLYQLGAIQFQVAPVNISEVSRETGSDFAAKDVMGAPRPREYVGEADERVRHLEHRPVVEAHPQRLDDGVDDEDEDDEARRQDEQQSGVPPAVAVGSQAPQILATSVSSLDQQWRRGNVDVRMGLTVLAGGLIGSALGVQLFGFLKAIGQIDVVIALAFIIMLSVMGGLMLAESSRTMLRQKLKKPIARRKLHQHIWVHGLPLKMPGASRGSPRYRGAAHMRCIVGPTATT